MLVCVNQLSRVNSLSYLINSLRIISQINQLAREFDDIIDISFSRAPGVEAAAALLCLPLSPGRRRGGLPPWLLRAVGLSDLQLF